MFVTDLFSHHRRNHLPHRDRTFLRTFYFSPDVSFSSSTGHNCSVHCLYTSINVHWKTYNYLTGFLLEGSLILVHLLEASGTKYIQGFFWSLPPTDKASKRYEPWDVVSLIYTSLVLTQWLSISFDQFFNSLSGI